MTPLRMASRVTRREIQIEHRGHEAATAVLPLVAVLVVLAGLAWGPSPRILHATAPGLVWLVTLVAAVPLAASAAAADRRDDAWDMLRCLVPPTALLAGKLAFTWLALLISWAAAALLVGVILGGLPIGVALVVGGLLGTFAIAVTTTVFGVLTAAPGGRPGLLAVLVLPAGLPSLLAGSQTATPDVPPGPWLALLAAYDLVIVTAAWAVFPAVLEDG